MPYPRRLSDDALAHANWEHENIPTSAREQGQKYGLGKSTLARWMQKQDWVKYRLPGSREFDAARAAAKRQIRELLRDTEHGEVVRGLTDNPGHVSLVGTANTPCEQTASKQDDALEGGQTGTSPKWQRGRRASAPVQPVRSGPARL